MQNPTVVPPPFLVALGYNPDEPVNTFLDRLQSEMGDHDPADCPVTHRFTDNQYIREIFMPAGSLIISKIHNTRHPFHIISGRVSVYTVGEGVVTYEGPTIGLTAPGTRRLLFIHEDCVWSTYHLLDFPGETVEQIEERIIDKRDISVSIKSSETALIQ